MPSDDLDRPDASGTGQPGADKADRLSLDQLSSLAGATPRTVRFYIAQGLLDRPAGSKRGAHYTRRHLEQMPASAWSGCVN